MNNKCSAGYVLPDWGACPKCGASENDMCLLVSGGKPTPVGPNPEALEALYEALKESQAELESVYDELRKHQAPKIAESFLRLMNQNRAALAKAEGKS